MDISLALCAEWPCMFIWHEIRNIRSLTSQGLKQESISYQKSSPSIVLGKNEGGMGGGRKHNGK